MRAHTETVKKYAQHDEIKAANPAKGTKEPCAPDVDEFDTCVPVGEQEMPTISQVTECADDPQWETEGKPQRVTALSWEMEMLSRLDPVKETMEKYETDLGVDGMEHEAWAAEDHELDGSSAYPQQA